MGTRSLLFGVHHVILHPLFVTIAWRRLYRAWPSWREFVCIVIHDWGYWGVRTMDGEDGRQHPRRGARIALWWLGMPWWLLCLGHSREYAQLLGFAPSPLCWADKLSAVIMPAWLYLLLGRLSGEVYEYRAESIAKGFAPPDVSLRDWHRGSRAYLTTVVEERIAVPVSAGVESFEQEVRS